MWDVIAGDHPAMSRIDDQRTEPSIAVTKRRAVHVPPSACKMSRYLKAVKSLYDLTRTNPAVTNKKAGEQL